MFQRYASVSFVVATVCILFFQNCGGGFGSAGSDSANSISNVPPASMNAQPIMSAETTSLMSNLRISFHVTALPAGASVLWSNTLNQNSPCINVPATNPNEYTLICPLSGSLVVNGLITVKGLTPIFLQDTYHLATGPATPPGPGDPTPTPAPTPKPATGQLLADQQVYTANCARCHGDVDYSSKRGTNRFNTDVAISNNVGQMGQLSALSPAARDQIIFALNNVQP